MLAGILLDFALVLYLQLTRNAVGTAVAAQMSSMQAAHIICSLIALFLYVPTVYYGARLLRDGSPELRRRHFLFAVPAYVLRTLGFLFMFSMIEGV